MVISLAPLKRGWASPIWSPHRRLIYYAERGCVGPLPRSTMARDLFRLGASRSSSPIGRLTGAPAEHDRRRRCRRATNLARNASDKLVTRLAGRVCIDELRKAA